MSLLMCSRQTFYLFGRYLVEVALFSSGSVFTSDPVIVFRRFNIV